MPDRTIKELMHLLKTDPGALTFRELELVQRHTGKLNGHDPDKQYERHKERARDRQRRLARAGQDIGPLPAVVNPARRDAAFNSLLQFCGYFPHRFYLPFSPCHLQVIPSIETAIIYGGLDAYAMPRGFGKTVLVEVAILWATMTGRHPFAVPIGVNSDAAIEMLDSIKAELEGNPHLLADFPEVCHPFVCLEGRSNRAKGQHIRGVRTHIVMRKNLIVFPTVEGSVASGAVIKVAGFQGRIRGMKYTRANGEIIRPTLVIPDDPQTDEEAANPDQTRKKQRIVDGAILGLAGPDKQITAICPCTIIRPGDFSSQILDRDKNPLWRGQTFKLLERFPEPAAMELWAQYAVMRADEFRNGGDGHVATAWYGQHRDVMDRGAVVSWPEKFNGDELSAIQHAMNLYYRNKEAFFAEYQNEPLEEQLGEGQLSAEVLAARVNGIERGKVPIWANHLTAYIDVQKACLWWLVAAWRKDFTGAIVDYGAWPDQQRPYFTLADVQQTLARALPGAGLEATILNGLNRCSELLLQRDWLRQDGGLARIEKLVIDANWGESTNTVYEYCRTTKFAALVVPSHGKGITCDQKPMSEYQRKPGEQLGTYWCLTARQGTRAVRHLVIDTNWWKSFIAERLMTAVGDKGAITLPGQQGADHRMLCDHLTAEYRTPTQGRGRRVDVWKVRPNRDDNHMFDGLTGAAVAASVLGCGLLGETKPVERQPTTWADAQKARLEFERRSSQRNNY